MIATGSHSIEVHLSEGDFEVDERTLRDPREGSLNGREFMELFNRKGLARVARNELTSLRHRLDVALGKRSGRTVLFLGGNAGAGASSIAYGYAQLSAQTSDRRVLIVEVREPGEDEPAPSISLTDSFARGRRLCETAELVGRNMFHNFLASVGTRERVASVLAEADFWQALTREFDEVVFDCSASDESQVGLVLSSHTSATILVVEAERTHKLAMRKLLSDLRMFQANVIGTVLNKRQHYIPRWIYRYL